MRLKISVLTLLLPWLAAAISTKTVDGVYEVEACDGEMATLACPDGLLIHNITANYGRMSINSCNEANSEYPANCLNFPQTKAILDRRCNASASCAVAATVETFGLPKNGEDGGECVYREGAFFLSAIYHCRPTTTQPTTTISTGDVSIDEVEERGESVKEDKPASEGRCPSRVSHGVQWKETQGSTRAIANCPNEAVGNATWSCHSSGEWSLEGPSLTDCATKDVVEALEEIRVAKKMKVHTKLDKTMTLISSSVGETQRGGKDLSLVLDFVHEITPILTPQSSLIGVKKKDEYRKLSLSVVAGLIDSPSAWNAGWSAEQKRGFASRYLDAIETLFLSTNSYKFYAIDDGRSVVAGEMLRVARAKAVRIPSMNIGDAAILPSEIFSGSETATVLFSSTRTLAQYLPPSAKPFALHSPRIVSNILTVSLVNDHKVEKVHLMKEKVMLVFEHASSALADLSNPRCVWWNGEARNGGDWSESGCSLLSHDARNTKCSCDHLTHFAVLMDVRGMELSPFDYSLLTLLTRIGCAVSIFALLATLLCLFLFSRHGGDRVFIHKNLCLTLAIAQTLFVFTISWTDNEVGCRVISSLLLYSFLSAFLWMFVEGVQLYFLLVDVFAAHSRRLKYALFAFGLPMVIVAATNYLDGGNMTSNERCWLAAQSFALLFAFIVPSVLIMVSNGFFLGLAIWIACRRSSNGYMPCKYPNDKKPFAWIRGSVSLMSLLGLTWSLGFYLLYDPSSLIVAYAFTALNTLQGLFIFLLHVVFNQKMRSDICDWLARNGCCQSGSGSGGLSSNDSSGLRRTANAFSPSNDSTALYVGGECSDSSMLPRSLYGAGGGALPLPYPTHEEMMRHHHQMYQQHYQAQQRLAESGEGGQYDYATIAYGDMLPSGTVTPFLPGVGRVTPVAIAAAASSPAAHHMGYAPPPYLRYGMLPPLDSLPLYSGTRLHQPRLPPPQGVPPLPPSSLPPSLLPSSASPASRISPPSSSRMGGVPPPAPAPAPPPPFRRPPSSDDSAYSDSSSSMFTSEVTVDGSTVLRMNLGRNSLLQQPQQPLFQHDV